MFLNILRVSASNVLEHNCYMYSPGCAIANNKL